MTSSTLTVMRCDRCGHQATLTYRAERADWAMIAVGSFEGSKVIGANESGHDDLCPGCSAQLFLWFAQQDTPVVQPPPPPAPPPAIKPVCTLPQRRAAIVLLTAVLEEQVVAAIGVMSEQPTSILSGDILPGALDGAERRAEAAIDEIIAEFELKRSKRRP